jgi:hypothetical protein
MTDPMRLAKSALLDADHLVECVTRLMADGGSEWLRATADAIFEYRKRAGRFREAVGVQSKGKQEDA